MIDPLGLFTQDDQQDPETREMLRRLGLLPAGGGPLSLPVPTASPQTSPPNPIQALHDKALTSPPAQQGIPQHPIEALRAKQPTQLQPPPAQPGVQGMIGYQAPTATAPSSPEEMNQQWENLIAAKSDRRASELATQLAASPPSMKTARKEMQDLWKSKGKLGKVGMVLGEALRGFGQQEKYVRPSQRAFERQLETWKEQGKQASGAARVTGLAERGAQQQARQYISDREKTVLARDKQKLEASIKEAGVQIKGLTLEQNATKLKYDVANKNRAALMKYEELLVNQTPKNIEQSIVQDAHRLYPGAEQAPDRQAFINIANERQLEAEARIKARHGPAAGGGPPKGTKMVGGKDMSVYIPATGHVQVVTTGIVTKYDPKRADFSLRRIYGVGTPEDAIPLTAAQAVTASAFEGSLTQVHSSLGMLTNAYHKGGEAKRQAMGLTSGGVFNRLRQMFGGDRDILGTISSENAMIRIAAPNQVWLHARALTKYRPSIEMVKELAKAINAEHGNVDAKIQAVMGLKLATELALYNDLGLISLNDLDSAKSTAKIAAAMDQYMVDIRAGKSPKFPHVLDIFGIKVPGRNTTAGPSGGGIESDAEADAAIEALFR